jgi:hypothetical protein
MRAAICLLVVPAALALAAPAGAKDFGPGDLRVCGRDACVPVVDRAALPAVGAFYYSGGPLASRAVPALGAPYWELRFRNGYVTGIVATRSLDRFLSYGVNLGRFARDRWYAVPGRLRAELRRLAAGLTPFRVRHAALARSR